MLIALIVLKMDLKLLKIIWLKTKTNIGENFWKKKKRK